MCWGNSDGHAQALSNWPWVTAWCCGAQFYFKNEYLVSRGDQIFCHIHQKSVRTYQHLPYEELRRSVWAVGVTHAPDRASNGLPRKEDYSWWRNEVRQRNERPRNRQYWSLCYVLLYFRGRLACGADKSNDQKCRQGNVATSGGSWNLWGKLLYAVCDPQNLVVWVGNSKKPEELLASVKQTVVLIKTFGCNVLTRVPDKKTNARIKGSLENITEIIVLGEVFGAARNRHSLSQMSALYCEGNGWPMTKRNNFIRVDKDYFDVLIDDEDNSYIWED